MKLHVCNGCGKEKMLDERVRHWHGCHPAKFSFIVKSDKEIIAQIVSATQPRLHLTATKDEIAQARGGDILNEAGE